MGGHKQEDPERGPMLQAGEAEFKASNGWLQSFKNHFGFKQLTVGKKVAFVPQETIKGWFE